MSKGIKSKSSIHPPAGDRQGVMMTDKPSFFHNGHEVQAPINTSYGVRPAYYGNAPYQDVDYLYEQQMDRESDDVLSYLATHADDDDRSQDLDVVFNPNIPIVSTNEFVPNTKNNVLYYERTGLDVDRDDLNELTRYRGKSEVEHPIIWDETHGQEAHGMYGADSLVQNYARELADERAKQGVVRGHGMGHNARTSGFSNGQLLTDRYLARRNAFSRYHRRDPINKTQLPMTRAPQASQARPSSGRLTEGGMPMEMRIPTGAHVMTQPVENYYETLPKKGIAEQHVGPWLNYGLEQEKQVRGIKGKGLAHYLPAGEAIAKEQGYPEIVQQTTKKKLVNQDRGDYLAGAGREGNSRQQTYYEEELEMRKPRRAGSEYEGYMESYLQHPISNKAYTGVDAYQIDRGTSSSKYDPRNHKRCVLEDRMEGWLSEPYKGLDGLYKRVQPKNYRCDTELGARAEAGGIEKGTELARETQRKGITKPTGRGTMSKVYGAGGYNNEEGGIYEEVRPKLHRVCVEKDIDSSMLDAYLSNPYTRQITNLYK